MQSRWPTAHIACGVHRLRGASAAQLTTAAVLVARALVALEDRGSRRELRADAFRLLDSAGCAIAAELRRRDAEQTA